MWRLALSLVSSLQTGARIKESVERSVRQAVILLAALIVFLFALGFGLVAAYHGLMAYGLTALEAAGIVAAVLAAIAIVLLLLGTRKRRPKKPDFVNAPAEGLAMVDQSVNKAMNQVGPLTLLAVAFAAGLLASRRR